MFLLRLLTGILQGCDPGTGQRRAESSRRRRDVRLHPILRRAACQHRLQG